MGYNNYHIRRRNRHFFEACRREMQQAATPLSVNQLIKRVLDTPPPEYYLSYNTVLEAMRLYRRGLSPVKKPKKGYRSSQAMYREVWDKVERLSRHRPRLNMPSLVAMVLAGDHPASWHISPSTARRILYSRQRIAADMFPLTTSPLQP